MSFEDLVGEKILSIKESNNSNNLDIETENHIYKYETYGDYCANAYIESIDNIDWLINEKVISTNSFRYNSEKLNYEVIDYHRYEISSAKGTCSIELRVSHNGYYGGCIKFVSKIDKDSN
jgi:hypothetical protein